MAALVAVGLRGLRPNPLSLAVATLTTVGQRSEAPAACTCWVVLCQAAMWGGGGAWEATLGCASNVNLHGVGSGAHVLMLFEWERTGRCVRALLKPALIELARSFRH